jgi:hypothetical protein
MMTVKDLFQQFEAEADGLGRFPPIVFGFPAPEVGGLHFHKNPGPQDITPVPHADPVSA